MRGVRIGRWRFAPPAWASVLSLAVAVTAVSLGNWQTGRAEEKLARQARIDSLASGPAMRVDAAVRPAGELVNRRLVARGRLLHERGWLIDNRIHNGRPGYHVVTPLLLEDGGGHARTAPVVMLVNRGWVAAPPRRDQLPEVDLPQGVLEIEGIGVEPRVSAYELAKDAAAGRVRQNLLIDRAQAELASALPGAIVQPVVLQQAGNPGASADGLSRDWPRPDARVDVNRAYALQWYALALMALAIWVGMNLKRQT
jgi:surfeit locus 1 family protein